MLYDKKTAQFEKRNSKKGESSHWSIVNTVVLFTLARFSPRLKSCWSQKLR